MRHCLERAARAERQAPEVAPKVPAGQREALVTDDRRNKKGVRAAGECGERGGEGQWRAGQGLSGV